MTQLKSSQDCCGCSACASICSHSAIAMVPDSLGFLHPQIDEEKCIKCGLCEKVCDFSSEYDKTLNLPEPIAYGARHKDIREVETSRSGAVFVALSDWIIEQGGAVYGVGYADHFRVVHKRALTREQCKEFKGSKYVQSDVNTVFLQVKSDLKSGKVVLFSGTPCQTAGLNSFIGKSLRARLFLVDIICHGVPSPYVWRDYLSYVEKKEGSPVVAVNFRDKEKFGWKSHQESFEHSNGVRTYSRTYAELFFSHATLRESCTHCPYANLVRPSDITIGDFWGWEKTNASFNVDNKGVSLLFLNTNKGCEWFECVSSQINAFSVHLHDSLQPNLQNPSKRSPDRDIFEDDYKRGGIRFVIRKYGGVGLKHSLRRKMQKIRSVARRILKTAIVRKKK